MAISAKSSEIFRSVVLRVSVYVMNGEVVGITLFPYKKPVCVIFPLYSLAYATFLAKVFPILEVGILAGIFFPSLFVSTTHFFRTNNS